jgi:hypothetical protein
MQQTGRGHKKQKRRCWCLKLLHHNPHNQQSPLTTDGGGGDGQEREDGVGEEGREEGGEESEQLLSLRSVFDCPYIQIKTVNDGKDGWECGWCGNFFAPRHASRAL